MNREKKTFRNIKKDGVIYRASKQSNGKYITEVCNVQSVIKAQTAYGVENYITIILNNGKNEMFITPSNVSLLAEYKLMTIYSPNKRIIEHFLTTIPNEC